MLSNGYESHPLWNSLTQVESQLQGFTDKSDERFIDLQKKTKFLRWVLERFDPMLISTQEMDSIQGQLQQAIQHILNNANNWAHRGGHRISDQLLRWIA